VTILLLRGSLAPSVSPSRSSGQPPRMDSISVNWRKSLEQQLEISEEGVPRPATP
jgi:hypothetical protein